MSYDLIIKNGTIVDGSGLPGYRADVAIADGAFTIERFVSQNWHDAVKIIC